MSGDAGGCYHTPFSVCGVMLEGIPSIIASKIFLKFIFLSGKGSGRPTFTALWISLQAQVPIPYLRGMQLVTGGPFPVFPSPSPLLTHTPTALLDALLAPAFPKRAKFSGLLIIFRKTWCLTPCALSAISQAGLGPNHGARCCKSGQ